MMKWTQAKSTSSDEEVQRSLDLLDRVLSEFEDIENGIANSTEEESEIENPPPVDRKTKPKNEDEKTKKEIYFGTSTVERSFLQGGPQRVETSVFLKNIGTEPTVVPYLSDCSTLDGSIGKPHQPSPLASNEVLTVDVTRMKCDTTISSISTASDVNTEVEASGAGSDEVMSAKGALSLWLKRDQDVRNGVPPPSLVKRRSLDDGQPVSLPAKTQPQRLLKPTNVVKPISQIEPNPQKSKLQRPLSLMVLNDSENRTKPLSPVYKRPAPPTPEKKKPATPSSPTSHEKSFGNGILQEDIAVYDKPVIKENFDVRTIEENVINKENLSGTSEYDIDIEEELPSSPLVRKNTYVISRDESSSIDYSVRSASVSDERVSSVLTPLKKRPAPKPPLASSSPNPPSIPESGSSLATEHEREREVLSDSSVTTEKATQATQTTLPRKKLSKRSSFNGSHISENSSRPDTGMKRRPHSMSPPYSSITANNGHEAYDVLPPPLLVPQFHSQQSESQFFPQPRMDYPPSAGLHSRAISHNILANERFYMEQHPMAHRYPQFDMTNPYLLQYNQQFQSQQYIPEMIHQQRRTTEHHILNRMNHAYHMNQRHSINLEHVLSLEQLQMNDPRFLAHSKSFNYGPKPVMGIQARRTQAHGTHSLEYPKNRPETEMLIHVNQDIILRRNGYGNYPAENVWFKNNLQDSGFEDALLEKKRFAPVIRDKLQKNTNIYLPSPPSPSPDYSDGERLDRFENDSLSGDSDRELSRVEKIVSDFHKSLPGLDRKISRDSMYSNDSLDTTENGQENTGRSEPNTMRSEGQWSAASFDFYSPTRKNNIESESEVSERTEKTLISSVEEITTLKRLISEGVIKLDEAPPDFVPPPPPVINEEINTVQTDMREKSPSIDSGQGSIPTTIKSDQPSYVKAPNKNAKPSKIAQKAVEKEQLKAVRSLDSAEFDRKLKAEKFGRSKSIEDLSRLTTESHGHGIALPKPEDDQESDSLKRKSGLFGRGSPKLVKDQKLKTKKTFGSTMQLNSESPTQKTTKKNFFFSFWKKKQYTLDPV